MQFKSLPKPLASPFQKQKLSEVTFDFFLLQADHSNLYATLHPPQ